MAVTARKTSAMVASPGREARPFSVQAPAASAADLMQRMMAAAAAGA